MKRTRVVLRASAVLAALVAVALAVPVGAKHAPRRFDLLETTIPAIQNAIEDRVISAEQLVRMYQKRIAAYDEATTATHLNSYIHVNRHALDEADERDHDDDRRRGEGRHRRVLAGIPMILKDNVDTRDMPTTAGSLAFEGSFPRSDAFITRKLRDAGAIILGKATMTEFANFLTNGMPAGYSSLGGYGFNPYDPRPDPRVALDALLRPFNDGRPALTTGGSSSGPGVAVAANLAAVGIGTETSGSILSPGTANGLVGIKPTVGLISRDGIIPITADQDTPGPMAKSVTDAAIMLGAMEGPDPNDPATSRCTPERDYTKYLKADGLKGARIGIPRTFYYDKFTPPGATSPRGGLNDDQMKAMTEAIAVLKAQGAVIVDPADIPSVVEKDAKNSILNWGICGNMDDVKKRECSIDFAYGMERDFNLWLASLGDKAPVKTLTDLRKWNNDHTKLGSVKYGQSLLDVSNAMDLELFKARYEADRARDLELTATHGIDEVMKAQQLDALLFPGPFGASIAARPGYPTVIVPYAMIPNAPTPAFPEGFNAKTAPYGVSFTGMACSEPTLLRLAYAFEQATKKRVPPPAVP